MERSTETSSLPRLRWSLYRTFQGRSRRGYRSAPTQRRGMFQDLSSQLQKGILLHRKVLIRRKTQNSVLKTRSTSLKRADITEVGIAPEVLLHTIGQAFAIMHFHCKIDGEDVQFHLGGRRGSEEQGYRVWILDFDRCKDTKFGEPANLSAVLTRSDLAIPRGRPGERGYEAFKWGYLEMAEALVSDELGKKVLAEFEKDQTRRERGPEIRGARTGRSRPRGRNFGMRSRSGGL